uniref:mediator of RNA polymerase II transcription subunit 31 isoform X1 n=1 Tax=Anopheles coluzzii TaxID=1518534 RepID=UPI0020FFEECF|nr:mediator of RNA polymerase II transcription subunit 31 isoform X1 [Anopheles coluzzii]XP_040225541.2 mediator of RNA polymerase II transcription subunit 31 isoform X1 [Anopheles coluzzii]XP_040225542.2 mediator of RNA polymerase II transcription subunit 31 isoform X1 [Anopheles coluzzii]XP_040225543.2 mediator of RNA polymerase II transcription subunit 31 isoform X1 [Anopheles coluzzii]
MANKMVGKGKLPVESEDAQKLRFQVELEFVQCLANPNYLHFLAQRGYFKDAAFVNYLKYLLYWKEPEYAKYLKFPMCLYFLDLLQYEHFRREIVSAQCCKFIDDQAILLWQHYTRRRTRLTALGTTSLTGLAVGGQPVGGGVQGTLLSNDPAIMPNSSSNNGSNNGSSNSSNNGAGGGGTGGVGGIGGISNANNGSSNNGPNSGSVNVPSSVGQQQQQQQNGAGITQHNGVGGGGGVVGGGGMLGNPMGALGGGGSSLPGGGGINQKVP